MSVSGISDGEVIFAEKRANGIYWAWRDGKADVINNSWRADTRHNILDNAIHSATFSGREPEGGGIPLGCVVVFAAGNFAVPYIDYPANCQPGILVVGGVDVDGRRKAPVNGVGWGSQYGPELDVMAPSVSIHTTDLIGSKGYNTAGNYYEFGQTSAAAPHVAGVAALILSKYPDLTQREVVRRIEYSARKTGGYNYATTSGRPNGTWHQEMGYGLVNAYAAVTNTPSAPTISMTINPKPNGAGATIIFSVDNPQPGASYEWEVNGTISTASTSPSILFNTSFPGIPYDPDPDDPQDPIAMGIGSSVRVKCRTLLNGIRSGWSNELRMGSIDL